MKHLRAALSAALFLLGATSPALAADVRPQVNYAGVQQPIKAGDTLGVAHGGTGAVTLTSHCALLGAGTSAAHFACPSTLGYVLTDNGAGADPTFQAGGGGGGTPGGTSGQIQYNNAGSFGGFTASGDATINTSTGAVSVVQAPKWTTGRTLSITGDLAYTSPTLDGSGNVTAAGTLATVNSNVGAFTNANITVNAKGLITAAANGSGTVGTTGSPASGNLAKFSGASTITNGDLSGDCTTAGTLAITCTKTGGVSFAASATTDTTSASNISSGSLALGRIAAIGANTVLGNATGSSAAPTALSVPSCSTATSALIWTSASGFSCNTALSASSSAIATNTQSGSSYTVLSSDLGKLIRLTNAGSISATLPTAGAAGFGAGWAAYFQCTSGTTCSLAASTSSIDGRNAYYIYNGATVLVVDDGTTFNVVPLVSFWSSPNSNAGYSLLHPDSTSTGGNSRGARAVDLQLDIGAATQVAGGNAAFVAGSQNTTSASFTTAIGRANTVSAQSGVALGYTNTSSAQYGVACCVFGTASGLGSVSMGYSTTSSGQQAFSAGLNSTADGEVSTVVGVRGTSNGNYGQFVVGGGGGGAGRAQYRQNIFWINTNGATAVRLTSDGGSAATTNTGALVATGGVLTYQAECVLRDTSSNAMLTFSWGQSLASQTGNASTMALAAGNPAAVAGPTSGAMTLAANPTITADTTNGGFNVSYTPPVANTHTIRAVCRLWGTETD